MGEPFDSAPLANMPRDRALAVLFDKIQVEQARAEELRRR
jgi:hypothetical protein